jgi:hypothetical protein
VRSCRGGCAKDKIQTMKSTEVMIRPPTIPARHTPPGACHSLHPSVLDNLHSRALLGSVLRSVLRSVYERVLGNILGSVQLSVQLRVLGRVQSSVLGCILESVLGSVQSSAFRNLE